MSHPVKGLLLEWLEENRDDLWSRGFRASVNDHGGSTTGTAVDLEGRGILGTICHWPPDTFEFGFNFAESGEEIFLQTKNLGDKTSLALFVDSLLQRLTAENVD